MWMIVFTISLSICGKASAPDLLLDKSEFETRVTECQVVLSLLIVATFVDCL